MRTIIFTLLFSISFYSFCQVKPILVNEKIIGPSSTEIIQPITRSKFRPDGCPQRVQEGNPRIQNGNLVFDGTKDGKYQIDPQIAVGNGFVFHAANYGVILYDTLGNYIDGIEQKCIQNGIDPKAFYDIHNRVFVYNVFHYWDSLKLKPNHISVSATNDPTGAWHTYPINSSKAFDGGNIGYSKDWIAYTYPGGDEETFVLRTSDAKFGKALTVYHFPEYLGQPAFGQDSNDEVFFLKIDSTHITVSSIYDNNGTPNRFIVCHLEHNLENFTLPPAVPQKGSNQLINPGARAPKNLVYQSGYLWFAHVINKNERAAVQWHQINLHEQFIQSGIIYSDTSNYIHPTIAVNEYEDVLIGFQEVNKNTYVNACYAYRNNLEPDNQLSPIFTIKKGQSPINSGRWGDYSGSIIDGDDLRSFWTIQSLAGKDSTGETVITKVKVPWSK